jgi:hypothetical protein
MSPERKRRRRQRCVGSRLDHALNAQARQVLRERYHGQQLPLVLKSEKPFDITDGRRCGESRFTTREEGASDGR